MTKKTQSSNDSSTKATTEAFMKLWQEKWGDMLKENGWPADFATPGAGHMPFVMPFMTGFGAPASSTDATLVARITELEKRITQLEAKIAAAQKTKTPAKARPKK